VVLVLSLKNETLSDEDRDIFIYNVVNKYESSRLLIKAPNKTQYLFGF